jgi:hypothetical protein
LRGCGRHAGIRVGPLIKVYDFLDVSIAKKGGFIREQSAESLDDFGGDLHKVS